MSYIKWRVYTHKIICLKLGSMWRFHTFSPLMFRPSDFPEKGTTAHLRLAHGASKTVTLREVHQSVPSGGPGVKGKEIWWNQPIKPGFVDPVLRFLFVMTAEIGVATGDRWNFRSRMTQYLVVQHWCFHPLHREMWIDVRICRSAYVQKTNVRLRVDVKVAKENTRITQLVCWHNLAVTIWVGVWHV